MLVKFLRNAEYPQIDPKTGKPCASRSKSYKAGEVYELTDDHAKRWLRRNAAEVVEPARREAAKEPATSKTMEK